VSTEGRSRLYRRDERKRGEIRSRWQGDMQLGIDDHINDAQRCLRRQLSSLLTWSGSVFSMRGRKERQATERA
jgi:hypothetical protein